MRHISLFFVLIFLAASNPAMAFQSIKFNYVGLGESPIGNYARQQSRGFNERTSNALLKNFISLYTNEYSNGRPIETVATEMGFDCKNSKKLICEYGGVYTYELSRPGYPNKRTAILITFVANFEGDEVEVQTSRKFLYGGIEN